MQLADWLRQTKTTQTDLAKAVGATQGRISQLLNGGMPSFALARRIAEVTDGQVTANDFLHPEAAQ